MGEVGWAWLGIGIARYQQDRARLAADYFAKALNLGWSAEDHDLVECAMSNLHALAMLCHDPARADERYWDMLHYLVQARAIEPLENLVATHARFLAEHGRFTEARVTLRNTARYIDDPALDIVHGSIQANLGMIHLRMGKPAASTPCFARALTIFTRAGSKERAGDAALDIAIAHAMLGDAEQQRTWLLRVLDEYAGCGAPERASTARKMLDML
jgi:tetratricopeptide (TPR) repeat protein